MRPRLPSRPTRATIVLLLALASPAAATTVVGRDMHPPPPGLEPVPALTDSLARLGRVDSVQAVLRPLIATARAARDRAALLWLRRRQAELMMSSGDVRQALEAAHEAVRLARAAADTASWVSALRFRYLALSYQGRLGEAASDLATYRRLATRAGDRYHLAWLDVMDAWLAQNRGDMPRARGLYQAAAESLHVVAGPADEAFARYGVAQAALRLGDLPRARREVRRGIELAHLAQSLRLQAQGNGDLGMIELDAGDPAAGERCYRECYATLRALGNDSRVAQPGTSVALAMGMLGRYEEAVALLDTLQALCESRELRVQLPLVLETRGGVLEAWGRLNDAEAAFSRVLDLGRLAAEGVRVDAVIGLARVRVRLGRPLEALELLEREERSLGRSRNVYTRIELGVTHAQVLNAMGQPEEAGARFVTVAAEAERLTLWSPAATAWLGAASAWHALARPAQARATLDRAERAWDRSRSGPAAYDWREQRGADLPGLTELAVELTLEQPDTSPPRARARAAFERLQHFKSRTLLERMQGPTVVETTTFEPVSLARLQDVVLRDGELLVDTFVGPRHAWAFAVSRDSFRVVDLGESRRLTETAALHRDLVGRPPRRGDASPEVATARLRQLAFGGLEDLIARARTLLLASDGALLRVPATVLFGAAGDPVVTRIPSATVLARLRAPGAGQPVGGTLLAIDWAGPGLPGAAAEVRELGSRYRGVEVEHSTLADPGLDAGALAGHSALHFAGHTEVDDRRPWLSALGGVRGPEGGALRAGDVAAMRLRSRLVVLSSCASAGGAELPGEGLAGLSSAFIAAGARSVVATLWPVDDGTTRRLMRRFYQELARGREAADALALAQRSIRGGRTAHPFYWGGFVLVGERGTRVPLQTRPPDPFRIGSIALAALAGLGLVFGVARRLGLRARR